MSTDITIRVVSLCVLLASTETLNGIARTLFLNRWLGKRRALRWSLLSGALLALGICWLWVPKMGMSDPLHLWGLGLLLALFMAAFDIFMGRWLLKRPWRKALDDFNPATGNYLIIGLALLVSYPNVVMCLQP